MSANLTPNDSRQNDRRENAQENGKAIGLSAFIITVIVLITVVIVAIAVIIINNNNNPENSTDYQDATTTQPYILDESTINNPDTDPDSPTLVDYNSFSPEAMQSGASLPTLKNSLDE